MNAEQKQIITAALVCSKALDLPTDQAIDILESYGYDHSNRFELSSVKFTAGLIDSALAIMEEEITQ